MKARFPFVQFLALLCVLAMMPGGVSAQKMDEGPELDKTKDYYAIIETTEGTFHLRLFADKAPVTVRNFVNLAEGTREFKDPKTGQIAKRPYFDGLTFHRVISGFMIQGGCPQGNGMGDPGYRFKDEFDPSLQFNKGGLLAMANAGPGTNGSQFFITEVPTPHLNNRHTIFGEVVKGEEVALVKKIASVPKGAGDRPTTPVTMKVRIVRAEKGTPVEKVDLGDAPAARSGKDAPKGS
jgi:peptidyl-prolyl cis-trans isomerase A (cyclophilin A)